MPQIRSVHPKRNEGAVPKVVVEAADALIRPACLKATTHAPIDLNVPSPQMVELGTTDSW
jgi:hypothetical protein